MYETNQAQTENPTQMALSKLAQEVGDIEVVIKDLENKLAVVLIPESQPEEERVEGTLVSKDSELVSRLQETTYYLLCTKKRLYKIMERLQT